MQFLHAKKLPLSTQLIGVDGGATRVRACEVEVLGAPIEVRLRAGPRGAEREYKRIDGFETPAELGLSEPEQLGEIQPREREQGWAWIEATAQCVLEVSRRRDAKNVLLGLAMPGLKTADGRGLAFARNGPRIPEFAERLTELLVCEGVELAAPIGELLGDGWCAGVGETWGEGGALHGWRTAYYLGGGTGLAEALVLGGELVPLLDVGEWFPPAWRCLVADSRVEDLLSARAINQRWAERAGFETPLERGRFPEDHVLRDFRAQELLDGVGRTLAEFVSRRALLLAQHSADEPEHPGPHVLERIVLGQRLGELFADPRTHEHLRRAFEAELGTRLHRLGLDELLPPGGGKPWRDLTRSSVIPQSVALGAAACALAEWSRAHA